MLRLRRQEGGWERGGHLDLVEKEERAALQQLGVGSSESEEKGKQAEVVGTSPNGTHAKNRPVCCY